MARINLDDLRADEEARNKKYVWDKPLTFNFNKHRRAAGRDRRLKIERREFNYDEYLPERRSKIQRRKVGRDRRKD